MAANKRRVILGLMTFGPDLKWGARTTSIDEFGEFLDLLQKRGYGEVDTARQYQGGQQESFTRAAGWKSRGLKLATKVFPVTPGQHSPDVITEMFETSLKELDTDCVDIFYLHAPDRSVPFAHTLQATDALYRQGKFKALGLSNYTAFELAEIVMTCQMNGWVRPSIFQVMYNPLARSMESELVPACRRYGLDIVVYNPLAGGFFSGKYNPVESSGSGGSLEKDTDIGGVYRDRYFKNEYFDALALIKPVVEANKLTMVETTLRWLVHHSVLNMTAESGGHDGVIVGASSLSQLNQNLDGLEAGPLPQDVLDVLEQAWNIVKAKSPQYWLLDMKYSYDTKKELFRE